MDHWVGVGCCLGAAALYILGRSIGRDAEALSSVSRVNQLKDLASLLETACEVFPLVVSISGRVGSDTPITSEFSGMEGVAVKETVKQHFLKKNDAGSWEKDSSLLLSKSREVPWYLDDGTGRVDVVGAHASDLVLTVSKEVFKESGRSLVCGTCGHLQGLKDDGTGRVDVVGAHASDLVLTVSKEVFKEGRSLVCGTCGHLQGLKDDGTRRVDFVCARAASDLVLTDAKEVFEESGRSLVCGTRDHLQVLKMLGVKRVETVLRTGTLLTVVGEAVKDDVGKIRIQRPHKGPFLVSPEKIDELILNQREWATWCKDASVGLGVFGIYLLAKHAVRYILERRRCSDLQKRFLAAAAQQNAEGPNQTAENVAECRRDTEMPDLCVICTEQQYNTVFVSCGHMCCCANCSSRLTNCPLCRKWITKTVKAYRH